MTPRPLFVQHAEAADRQRAAPVQVVPAGYRFAVVVPVRTIGQNAREHFRVKAARVKAERHMVRLMLDARAVRCPLHCPRSS
jgi:hypothetical protein